MEYTVRRDNGNRIIWEQSQIDYIKNEYNSGNSCTAIAKQFNVGRDSIGRLLKKEGIHVKSPKEYYQELFPKNENYFNEIDTPEKAYWLGFLYADGCITCGNITISLQESDYEQLKQFQQDIGAINNKITKTQKDNKFGWQFTIRSSQMIKDLKKLGCVERKSLILTFPTEEQVPKKYIYDFIRGYFDGDGTLSFDRRRKTPQARFGFTGTKEMLLSIQDKLEIELALQPRGNAYAFVASGNKQAKKFFNKIYDNPTRYLKRKYELYQSFLSYCA